MSTTPHPRPRRLLAWVRVTRMPLSPTAVCDMVACGLLAAQLRESMPTLSMWLVASGISLCLYLSGMAANDLADRKRDVTLNPNRPLPSGALSPRAVLVGLVLLGALALAGAAFIGSLTAAAAALAFALLYDFVIRRPWWLAALCMGSVRFANGALLVAPFVFDGSLTPLALAAPACIGLYSAAITVWSTTEDFDAPGRRHVARAMIVAAFGGAGAMAWSAGGTFTIGAVFAAGVISSTIFHRTPRSGHAKKQTLELLLGLYFLAAVIAGATHDASLPWGACALLVGWGLSIASQLWIHRLIKRAAKQ